MRRVWICLAPQRWAVGCVASEQIMPTCSAEHDEGYFEGTLEQESAPRCYYLSFEDVFGLVGNLCAAPSLACGALRA